MEDVVPPDGCVAVYPIRDNGIEMMWGCVKEEFLSRLSNGYIRVGKYTPDKPQKYVISYLTGGIIADIANGKAYIESVCEDGSVNAFYYGSKEIPPTTNWNRPLHDAQWHGSNLLKTIFQPNRFSYPKSLYAVKECLYYATSNKPNALIVDFFAGSGTTLHAVNLLNKEDGGNRRCIMVTNNEVSVDESKELADKGYKPGDTEWNNLGVARYITWPRSACFIKGVDINGNPIKGEYAESNIPMSEGFKANAVFFQLGFLDKNAVALGRQFKELLPVLWMKAGAVGKCPNIDVELPDYVIYPENKMAVLINELYYMEFVEELEKNKDIETVYIITDSEAGYRDMINGLDVKNTYQLYRDYLDNFRINSVRR